MGNPRRMYLHKSLYMVTSRLTEGLPFVPNAFINTLILGVLARTQQKVSDIEFVHFVFMGNHYHGFIVTRGDPKHVARFLNLLNGELAKILQRILGRRNTKVWAQRTNVIQILDFDSAIKELTYAFANPSAAHLVDSIDDWRGVSSWAQLFNPAPLHTLAVLPSHLSKLPNANFRPADIRRYLNRLYSRGIEALPLLFQPFAFKDCFAQSAALSNDQLRQLLVDSVRRAEADYRKERIEQKISTVGANKLAIQNPYKEFKSSTFNRRVFCVSTDPELRRAFIAAYREFCALCRKAWHVLQTTFSPALYPPAAFIPAAAPRASGLPWPL